MIGRLKLERILFAQLAYRSSKRDCEHKCAGTLDNVQLNRCVKVTNYENKSSWIPGRFVVGIGPGDKPTIVGGRCSPV